MKTLTLGLVVAVSSFAFGCSTSNNPVTPDAPTSHPDAPSGGGSHLTTYNWKFSDIAFNTAGDDTVETATACPGGTFDTAAVISQQSDSSGTPVGSCDPSSTTSGTCFVDLYDCSAMTGTETLPTDYYIQWVAITNHAGTSLYADTVSALIDETADNTVSADILNDGGYFSFAWALKDQSGNDITCADIPNDGISLDSTVAGTSNAVSDVFTCTDGSGITSGLPTGTYGVSSSILNSQQQAIGTTNLVTDPSIDNQNKRTDLGTITIQLM